MQTETRILVVEDEMIVQEDLIESLKGLGYGVCGAACCGEDAVEMAAKEIPDLVIMDIKLRGKIDGIETAELLRGRREVPVIFLTSYTDSDLLNRAKLSEPYAYLTKPFSERELHAGIQMALHRAQLEKRLRESEARYRGLLQAIPDPVVVYDAEGKVTFINEGFRKLYGWSGEDLMGHSIDFVPPEEMETTRESRERLLAGQFTDFETKRLTREGKQLDIQISASVLRNPEDTEVESIVVHRDVTKRKMAERMLREAQTELEKRVRERTAELLALNKELKEEIRQRKLAEESVLREKENLERVFEAMEDGVHIVDQQYEIQYVNRSLEKDMGPVQGRKCYAYFHDRSDPCPKCYMQELFRDKSVRQEWRSSKSGKTYELLDTVLHNADGSLSKLEIFRDITKRKEMEAQLRHAQKMQAVGTLAAGIAHDFNNLLSPIVMGAEMALEEVEEGTAVSLYLSEIKLAADRAADLVRQILVLSRFEEPRTQVIALGSIVEECTRFLRATLPATIVLKCDIKTGRDTIEADPTQIQQVLMNLSANAAHAMGTDGGILEIELENVTVDCDSKSGVNALGSAPQVKLTVRDSGHGMTADVKERIFEPYFTTKAAGEGSGLGLAIVHGIVESHRGAIKVKSAPGKGTEFSVHFPLAKDEPVASKKDSENIRKGAERVLFVDDEPAIVAMAGKMLKAMGYDVTLTTSSAEAFEIFRKEPHSFDLVITDMTMPEMTGKRLARSILEIRPDIPVILTTGYSDQITLKETEEMGIRSIAFKPIGRRGLSEALRKALD